MINIIVECTYHSTAILQIIANVPFGYCEQGEAIILKSYQLLAVNCQYSALELLRLSPLASFGIGRLMVEVGPKEIVKNTMIVWWPALPEKEVTLRSVHEALEDVKAHRPDLVSSNIPPEAVSATIDKVLLAYWADPDVSYVQPVWVFAGEAKIEGGRKERYDAVTPAIAGVHIYSP